MNKSSIQRKFRFVMIIAALALFITIFTPTYINFSKSKFIGYPKVVMMWTVLFGTGGGKKLNPLFDFSWVAFIGYAFVLILLVISLVRKFITVEGSEKTNNIVADAACMILSILSLVMFVLLPIVITKTSANGAGALLVREYGWGVSYILAYIILAVMVTSSVIVVCAEQIVKIKKIRAKKQENEKKNSDNE